MSLPLRLLLVPLVLSSTGCLEALQKHNAEVRAERRHGKIEAACKERNTDELREAMKNEPDHENLVLAKRCHAQIKLDELLATDCPTFSDAFAKRIRRQEGKSEISSRNPLIDFSVESFAGEEQLDKLELLANKARTCNDTNVLFGYDGHAVAGWELWAAVLDRLDEANHDVYPLLVRYLQEDDRTRPSAPDSVVIVRWLRKSQDASKCPKLEAVTRGKHLTSIRADLLYFFAGRSCKREVSAVAGELLASPLARHRMDACFALRDAGDTSHVGKMRRLAQTDTARAVEEAKARFWTYAYVTYPVREACQQALNELELKHVKD